MADLIGQRLGQYEIVALLGEGGMAAVYRARQPSMDRDVAVKVIESKLARNPEFVKRFEREARTVAALSHPFILKVFDYGQQGDLVYLVMELLNGGSLAELIGREPLSVARTGQVLDQVASALDYAHRRGIIHRDLKPQNVLLDEEGNAHLTDFGIVKLLSETTALTQSGLAMGTPTYMAPEQWQGKAVDARADLYALGVMLFEMLAGQLPFVADTPFGLMHQHVYDPPPSIRALRRDLPSGVEQVLSKALAKEPDQRFQTAHDLAAAFKTALANMAPIAATPGAETTKPAANVSVPAPQVPSTVVELPVARRQGPAWLPFAAVAGIVIVVSAFLVILTRGSGQGSATPTVTITQTNVVAAVPSTTAIPPTRTQPSATPLSAALAASATHTSTPTPIPSSRTSADTPIPSSPTVPPTIPTHTLSATEIEETIQAVMNLSLTEQPQTTATTAKNMQIAATMSATLWTATPTPNLQATANARLTATQNAMNQMATANAQTSTPQATATPAAMSIHAAGETRVDAKGVSQVWVSAGCFQMGSDPAKDKEAQPDEQPQHEVCLTQGYWLDAYEVTNEAYQKFIDDGGYTKEQYWSAEGWQWAQSNEGPQDYNGFTGPKQPRVGVTWYEADAYARWRGGRLPTEAEWEYAARGPKAFIYPWGDRYDKNNLNAGDTLGHTTYVGHDPSGTSWVGAYEMAGNVWEWVNDWYSDSYYGQKVKDDPPGPASGEFRGVRGGSWLDDQSRARAAYRYWGLPAGRSNDLGFRVVTVGDSSTQMANASQWTATPPPAITDSPTASPTLAPGATRMDEKGTAQVWVPAGCFQMGSDPAKDRDAQPDEQPQHEVCLTQGYWIDAYEVTNDAYQKFFDDGGYTKQQYWSADGWQWAQNNAGPVDYARFIIGPNQPRVGVTWYEAEAYARWRGGRLPTEAEWEYAARGPQSFIYPWGDRYDTSNLNVGDRLGQTTYVGRYPSGTSWIGAYDMAGNVWEWVNDWYGDSYYGQKVKDNPLGPASGEFRGVRGGSWLDDQSRARAAYRYWGLPAGRSNDLGFRVVTVPK